MIDVPDEPPPWVTERTLWRLAICVIHDHRPSVAGCVCCAGDWPCPSRMLAGRALIEAQRVPRPRRVRNQAYLDWISQYARRTDRP